MMHSSCEYSIQENKVRDTHNMHAQLMKLFRSNWNSWCQVAVFFNIPSHAHTHTVFSHIPFVVKLLITLWQLNSVANHSCCSNIQDVICIPRKITFYRHWNGKRVSVRNKIGFLFVHFSFKSLLFDSFPLWRAVAQYRLHQIYKFHGPQSQKTMKKNHCSSLVTHTHNTANKNEDFRGRYATFSAGILPFLFLWRKTCVLNL